MRYKRFVEYHRKACLVCNKVMKSTNPEFVNICEWDAQFVKKAEKELNIIGITDEVIDRAKEIKKKEEYLKFTEWK